MPTLVAQYTWNSTTESPDASTNMTRSTTTVHDGAGSVRLLAPNDVAYWLKNAVGVTQVVVMHAWMRWHDLPNALTPDVIGCYGGATPGFMGLGFDFATGKMFCEIGSQASPGAGGPVLALDTWYEVDVGIVANAGTVTVNGRINQQALPQNSRTGGPFTLVDYRLGEYGVSETYDLFFDTLDISHTAADYPLGAPAPTAPLAPQVTQATPADSQVTITWIAPASDGGSAVTGYKVYRGVTPNGESLLASPAGTGTTYIDPTVVNGTTYYYKVSAVNAVGESVLSNEYFATPNATVLARVYKRLYGPTLLGNAAATLYTVPAATTAVIRHIHVSNPSGSPVDFTLSIGASAAATRIWDAIPIAADDVLDHYQDFTLSAAEIVQGFASLAATLNLTIDGYTIAASAAQGPIYPSNTLFPSDTSP